MENRNAPGSGLLDAQGARESATRELVELYSAKRLAAAGVGGAGSPAHFEDRVGKALRAGADPNAVGQSGERLIFDCLRLAGGAGMEQLLEHGADVGARLADGSTPLFHCFFLTTGRVAALLRAGADPNARNKRGATALDAALEQYSGRNRDLAVWLAESGGACLYDWRSLPKDSPAAYPWAHKAIRGGRLEFLEYVWRSGCCLFERYARPKKVRETLGWVLGEESETDALEEALSMAEFPSVRECCGYLIERMPDSALVNLPAYVKALEGSDADPAAKGALMGRLLAKADAQALSSCLGADEFLAGQESRAI